MANFGIDLYVQDHDLLIGSNGDFFCTDDLEYVLNQDPTTEVQFEGYVCLRESIVNILNPEKGTYSHLEPNTGVEADLLISSGADFEKQFNNFIDRLNTELGADERIASINDVTYKYTSTGVNIYVSLTPTGLDIPIPFVFPLSL